MGRWILFRGGEKGKCCGRAQGFSSMASSGQQWLLGCGDPNIRIWSVPAATAGEFRILPIYLFFQQMYLQPEAVLCPHWKPSPSYRLRCALNEISQICCSWGCTRNPSRGWRGWVSSRPSRQKGKHCTVSHWGTITWAISRCLLLADWCQTAGFEGLRSCRSGRNGIHSRYLHLSESDHPSLLLYSAERQLSVWRGAKQLS